MLRLMCLSGRQRGTTLMVGLSALLVSGGCASLGPTTINRDRFDYITAISESWKKQTLLNIVKIRYADTPVFLEVGQVISGYEVEGSLSAGGTIGTKNAAGALGDFVNFGAGARYLDRPTVTYSPLTGPDFIKTMMTPFPPGAVMFLVETGWPADLILQISVQTINGLRNHKGGPSGHPPDPSFLEILRLLHRIQESGGMGIGLQRDKDNEEATILLFQTRRLTTEVAKDVATVKEMLGIKPDVNYLRITYGADAQGENEVALQTRSAFQVLIELASLVSVPSEHVADHRTYGETLKLAEGKPPLPGLVTIQSSSEEPTDAFARIWYRDHWFWIDDRDFQSKRVLTFLMVLFTISDTGQKIQPPILTIRAN